MSPPRRASASLDNVGQTLSGSSLGWRARLARSERRRAAGAASQRRAPSAAPGGASSGGAAPPAAPGGASSGGAAPPPAAPAGGSVAPHPPSSAPPPRTSSQARTPAQGALPGRPPRAPSQGTLPRLPPRAPHRGPAATRGGAAPWPRAGAAGAGAALLTLPWNEGKRSRPPACSLHRGRARLHPSRHAAHQALEPILAAGSRFQPFQRISFRAGGAFSTVFPVPPTARARARAGMPRQGRQRRSCTGNQGGSGEPASSWSNKSAISQAPPRV